MEAWLILGKVVEVDQFVRSVALRSPVVTVQLTATDALTAALLLPRELVGLELGAFVRTVAPGLTLAVATRAPEVSLALLHINLVASSFRHVRQHRRFQVCLVSHEAL